MSKPNRSSLYTTVFFRAKFVVTNRAEIVGLNLEALYDDGFKVWINGTNVLNANISTGEVPFDDVAGPAREDGTYNTFALNSPQSYLVTGTNIIAIQAANSSMDASSDFFLDVRLIALLGSAGRGPTPGARNSVYATNLPPQIRQVDHSPNQPSSGQPVKITAQVTDPEGVASVALRYQLVDPGSYLELTDPAYSTNWTSVVINNAGVNGDDFAGDSIYSVELPASLQSHRRLVRYRITATDSTGATITVPYGDDQQGDYLHRGEQGMFESVGYALFRLAGVHAPLTTHVQFRIVDNVSEAPPANQFGGDFWGLYLVVEEQDGRFLDERGLPDGNVYDMESGTGTLNNLGPDGPLDKSDLNAFLNSYNTSSPPDSWWRTNLDLPQYYGYQAILQGFHHYDIADGKNYFYYRNPVLGQWEVWPWDLDLSWADNMYRAGVGGGDEPFKSRVLSNFSSSPAHPALVMEFRNRVREIRDLLFNADQAFELIDEMAALIRGSAASPSIIDADRAQWDYNPVMANSSIVNLSKAGQGRFYRWPNEPSVTKDFNGCIQLMKNYVNYRATTATLAAGVVGLDGLAADPLIPNRPTISATGPANFPLNRLTFRSSAYSGSNPFAAMKWRVGELTDTNSPAFNPAEPHHYEITASWESDEAKFDLVTASGGTVTLRFTAAANQSYTIQYRDDLASGGWQDLTNVLAGAATRVADVPDPAGGGTRERFYRLVTPLTP